LEKKDNHENPYLWVNQSGTLYFARGFCSSVGCIVCTATSDRGFNGLESASNPLIMKNVVFNPTTMFQNKNNGDNGSWSVVSAEVMFVCHSCSYLYG
jgi:hypothetical protein